MTNGQDVVTVEEGEALVEKYGCCQFQTSAKDGNGVRECFEDTVRAAVARGLYKQANKTNKLTIQHKEEKEQGKCC